MIHRVGLLPLAFLAVLGSLLIAGCSGTPGGTATLSVATSSLPSGTVSAAYSATVTATGGLAPFTWSVASGSLPAGLSLGASTSRSVTITGTPTATGTSAAFTIQVIDANHSVATSAPLTITVTNLAIVSTSPLPGATAGTAYSFQFQATGGTAPYTWTVATGSTLPAGLTLSGTGLLSGTPTAAGTNSIKVTLTDSESPAASVTGTFSLTIGGVTGTSLLNGHYAFTFSGFSAQGAEVAAGSFSADGAGHLSGGVADFNFVQGTPKNQTFTGTYTLGSDNRGLLTFNTSSLGTMTYAFALNVGGTHGRLVEFDSTGVRGSGELVQQTVSSCASSTLSGSSGTGFVIGVTGTEGNFTGTTPGPMALAGRFTAEVPANAATPGNIDTGEVDANVPQQNITRDLTFSGTFQTTAQSARCSMSVSQSLGNMTFSVYPVLGSGGTLTEAFVVETDTPSSTQPYVSVGKIIQQIGQPFAQPASSFTAPSVGALSGSAIPSGGSSFLPFGAVVILTGSGSTGFNISLTENIGGDVQSFPGPNNGSFANADSFGRLETNLTSPIQPVFYVIGPNTAMCILENISAPILGLFEPQATGTTFSASTIRGTFVEGTAAPSLGALQDYSGVVALDGATAVSGTQDTSTSGANSPGQTVTGTYGSIGSSTGNGVLTLTSPAAATGAFVIVSPTKFVGLTTTATDTNPVVTIYGDQADAFGVN